MRHRQFLSHTLRALTFAATLLAAASTFATANYVYH